GAGEPDQHGEQLALVVRDLPGGAPTELTVRLLGEVAAYVVGGLGVGDQIVVDGGVHDVHPASLAYASVRELAHVEAVRVVPEHVATGHLGKLVDGGLLLAQQRQDSGPQVH